MQLKMQQGSTEWLKLRKTKISGTDAAIILGLNPWKDCNTLYMQKLGQIPEDEPNENMKKGTELEPIARSHYEKFTGNLVGPTIHLHDEHNWAMCSTDGLTLDGEILLEIKCGQSAFKKACSGIIPDYYRAQLQHCLWVTGALLAHYYCYSPKRAIMLSVERDNAFIEKMVEAEYEFFNKMQLNQK